METLTIAVVASHAAAFALGALIRRGQVRYLRTRVRNLGEAVTYLALSAQTGWSAADKLAARNQRYAEVIARRRRRHGVLIAAGHQW